MASKEIVMAFKKALGESDWSKARNLLDDNLSFKGPMATYQTPEPYIEDLKKVHGIVQGVDMKKIFVDGNDVCLMYDMRTNSPAGTAFICEWYSTEGEKIKSITVVFDARPFAAMFQKT